MTKREQIYADTARDVIEALDNGVVPWRQPWDNVGGPRSIDGRPYRGWNIFQLLLTSLRKGYGDPRWGTFDALKRAAVKQARSEGRTIVEKTTKTKSGYDKTTYYEVVDGVEQFFTGGVRKGEKGTYVILSKKASKKRTSDTPPDEDPGSYWFLTNYVVFNAEQADGLPEFVPPVRHEHERVEAAEQIIADYADGPIVNYYHGDSAHYIPELDRIDIPKLEQFERNDAYYSTVFHELAHSTAHKTRLDRPITGDKTSPVYWKEELIAEFGAAMLTGIAGIQNQQQVEQSAAYIASWRARLTEDPSLVYQAASAAQRAADRILGTTFEKTGGSRESGSHEPTEALVAA